MRITQNTMVNNMMNNLQKNVERLDGYNQRLSSGKQFQHPSQAPIQSAKSMNYTSLIEKSEQFEENVDQARSWLETTESAMSDANEVQQRARELTIRGANDTLTETERENLAQEMEELRGEMLSITETKHGDRYVFSGQKTGQKPFDEEGNYQGDYKNIVREINPGVEMPINVNGEKAFAKSIDALDNVIKDLRSGNARIYSDELNSGSIGNDVDMEVTVDGTSTNISLDSEMTRTEVVDEINEDLNSNLGTDGKRYARLRGNQIEFRSFSQGEGSTLEVNEGAPADNTEATFFSSGEYYNFGNEVAGGQGAIRLSEEDIGNFDGAIDDSLTTRSEVGAKMNRLDLTDRRLEDEITSMRKLLSENEDTNVAETIMEMRMEESVYQASLATGARTIQPTLVDFLQ